MSRATVFARETRMTGASLADCLDRLARRHGLADALRRELPPKDRGAFGDRATLRRARAAGLRGRRQTARWEDLPALLAQSALIVSFTDGTCLLLDAITTQDGAEVAVLHDPLIAGGSPLGVDRIRFAAVWTGEVISVRPHGAAATTFGWRTVRRLALGERRLVRDIAGAALALGALAVVPILVIQLLLQRVIPARSGQSLAVLGLALLVAVVLETVLAGLRGHLLARLVARLDARLANDLFDRLLRLPAVAVEALPAGAVARALAGRDAIRAVFDSAVLGAVLEIGTAVVALPLLVYLDPVLAVIVILALALGGTGLVAAYGPIRRAARTALEAQTRRDAFLAETLGSVGIVRGLSLAPRRLRLWLSLTSALGQAEHRLVRAQEGVGSLAGPIERLILAGTLGLGILLPALRGETAQLGPLVAVYLLVQRLLAPLAALAALLRRRAEAEAAVAALAALLNQPAEAPHPLAAPSAAPATVRGGIVFEHVSFCYPGRTTAALSNASFAIAPGTTFGIMGRSRAGKSTIARLLQHHATTYGGAILLDGIDLRDMDIGALRRAVVVVDAASALFAGTIREIITAARPEAGFAAMVRAARIAGADSFIETLPRGYDTRLDDGAPTLAAGQRQRLALARALLAEPAVLVLDDALSALDAEVAAVVDANLRQARQGRTTVIIAHRLAMLANADTILVLADGTVRDCGTHADLLERCDLYAAAWARQGGFGESAAPSDDLLAFS